MRKITCRSAVALVVVLVGVLALGAGCKDKSGSGTSGEPTAQGPKSTLGPEGEKLLAEKKLEVPDAGKALKLAYKFETKSPVSYGMEIDAKIGMNISPGGRQKMNFTLGMDFDQLTQVEGSPATVEYAFKSQKADMDMLIQGQAIKFQVDGNKVKGSADGAMIVDTEKGIGKQIADEMLKEFDFAGKKATAKCDGQGRADAIEGDDLIVDMLKDQSGGEGPLPLILPDGGEVKIGVPWWTEFKLEKLQNVSLKGNPIEGMIRFVAVGEEELYGKKVVKIQMDGPMVVKNRKAQVELEDMGTTADATIHSLERIAHGMMWFDPAAGVLLRGDLTIKVKADMSLQVMGQTATLDMTADLKMKLTGTSGAAPAAKPE